MKLFLLSVGCMFASLALNAQDRSINFEHSSWAEIKAKAAKEKKIIFLDCYTARCAPCKKMANEVFTNNEVSDYFNANFINVKLDMEVGEGLELAKEYDIKAYPTLMFVRADSKLVTRNKGAMNTQAFLDFGKKSVSGEPLESLIAEYKKGNRKAEFMTKYIARMVGSQLNPTAFIEEYFSNIPQAQWQTSDNWYFIDRYIKSEKSPVFKYIFENQKTYEEKFSAESLSEYFVKVYRNSINQAAHSLFPIEDLKDLKAKFHSMNFAGAAKLEMECDAEIADQNKDLKAYVDAMEVVCSKYPEKDKEMQVEKVGAICRRMLLESADIYVLQKTAKMAEMSTQVQNPEFMDVYARLLFQTGNIDKAIEVEEKTIAMLKVKPHSSLSLTDCQTRLEKFKHKKSKLSLQPLNQN